MPRVFVSLVPQAAHYHWQLTGANGRAFSKFPKKRATLRGIPRFSKISSRKFSFHSILLLENLEFSVEWFAFRKLNSVRDFWKLFREFSVPFAAFPNFRKFWLNGKRLYEGRDHWERSFAFLSSMRT